MLHEIDDPQQDFMTVSNSLIENSGGSASWGYSNIQDGGGNIDTDPLFVEGSNHLSDGSPAIGSGNIAFLPNYEFQMWDLDGQSRFNFNTGAIDINAKL